ncbi:hypothetical protein HOL21_03210 [Candidatus Woesearchaeota archaeon]|jgi:hypothetical protein|nr:hypothetical protein [Candidatus Woesearchaeota archaeon]MBT5397196.1 hypothetical protein [Candidatus Woesearchaeota archaeon]MBT5924815.1 hypothetical protein [Candidatus Woesearchaeota archaeon]MBT6367258.1 hypothetical protein [Candidatus Woesearchaeota archaeon]MBT7762596.1 hypothetical protein [Candidatus Woesearchaeota archaeon]
MDFDRKETPEFKLALVAESFRTRKKFILDAMDVSIKLSKENDVQLVKALNKAKIETILDKVEIEIAKEEAKLK